MATVEELITIDAKLSRSFVGVVCTFGATLLWALFFARTTSRGFEMTPVSIVLSLLQLGFYVWYAVAAGKAATALGDNGWKFVVWILAAPFLGLLPIPVIGTLIRASPLAIKFLLGGRLQTAIRQASVADFHGTG